MYSSSAVLIPAHNEEDTVGLIISDVQRKFGVDVILIDDASTDGTALEGKKAGATVLSLSLQLGAWGAAQTGIRYAYAQGYRYVITMDADGQHEADYLPQLCNPVYDGEADVMIGTCVTRGSLLRKIAWVLLKKVSGLSLEDITSGFRVYNRKAMAVLASRESTLLEYQDIGVLILLQCFALRIKEIDVGMLPRKSGHSRVFSSWMTVIYYMYHSLLLGMSKRTWNRG